MGIFMTIILAIFILGLIVLVKMMEGLYDLTSKIFDKFVEKVNEMGHGNVAFSFFKEELQCA